MSSSTIPVGGVPTEARPRALKKRPPLSGRKALEENADGMSDKSLLGHIVTWDISGHIVRVDDLRDAMTNADINPDALPDLSMKNAFKRATKGMKKDRLIDELKTNGDVVSFQLTKKVVLEDMIDHDYECLIKLDIATGVVTCPERPELAKEAADLLDEAADVRTSPDVSRLVQRLFESQADLFPICPRKGVAYFVPIEHKEFMRKVEKFLGEVGGVLSPFPVPVGTEEGNRSVKDAVNNGLGAMAEELEEAINEWDNTTRADTKKRAQEKVELLLHKHQCYSHFLGEKQSEGIAKLDELKLRIVDAQLKSDEEESEETSE